MIIIALTLLGAWILSLFNFDNVIIQGMLQVFGISIDITGYYFIFAVIGILKSLIYYTK